MKRYLKFRLTKPLTEDDLTAEVDVLEPDELSDKTIVLNNLPSEDDPNAGLFTGEAGARGYAMLGVNGQWYIYQLEC